MNTIAVIEDDLPIGNLLEEVLTKAGYAVRRAYSGTEALYLLEREKPDLALLDLIAPRALRGGGAAPFLRYTGDRPHRQGRGGGQGEAAPGRGGGLFDQAL